MLIFGHQTCLTHCENIVLLMDSHELGLKLDTAKGIGSEAEDQEMEGYKFISYRLRSFSLPVNWGKSLAASLLI